MRSLLYPEYEDVTFGIRAQVVILGIRMSIMF